MISLQKGMDEIVPRRATSLLWLALCGVVALAGVGCMGQTHDVGRIVLAGTDTATVSARINFDTFPNRQIYFTPVASDSNQTRLLAAYREPIYSSQVTVTVVNKGKDPVFVDYGTSSQKVTPRGSFTLGPIPFKECRFSVGTHSGMGHLEFNYKFDRALHTQEWKVVAAWSDGP